MRFVLVNNSTDPSVTPEVVQSIATACELQLTNEYASHWQAAGIPVAVGSKDDAFKEDQCVVQILDSLVAPKALGYHATNGKGRPDIFVGWGIIAANGGTLTIGSNSLSDCISHELLEAARDPYCTFWADRPDGTQQALEIGDPVEGDSYAINGISVSNFVRPRYFSRGAGPYDHMETLKAPFTMSPGGYSIVRMSSGAIVDVFANAPHFGGMPEWKRQVKRENASSRMARRLGLCCG